MKREFYIGNRQRLYEKMKPDSLLVIFSGNEIRKTNDEFYPFFAHRNFVYLTGLEQKELVLVAMKDGETVKERIYILKPDMMAERWTGKRINKAEAELIAGFTDVRYTDSFIKDISALFASGKFERVYLDLYKADLSDIDMPAHGFAGLIKKEYPYMLIDNADVLIRQLRLIKQPCEIEALRMAEKITGEGILAMMISSKPGMYEYQYKAEFDRAIGQYGPYMHGFPPIISAGQNNFCIHYYSYTGQAHDGDMVLNDVGANYMGLINDVSRGWPVNGRFTDKQRILYECALKTSDHMFSIIRPGMKMADVDKTIREFNAGLLVDAGVLDDVRNIGKYMWHGGAHHIGFDVHDVVATPDVIDENMCFCVDIGIYHEEWGIGFRLEDNCLVKKDGCENLSSFIPRTIQEIEDVMRK